MHAWWVASGERSMRFGERVRDLRIAKGLSQRKLGERLGVSFTYVSKIENEKLDSGDSPSEQLICKIAKAIDVDEEELLILAKKIPAAIRRRIFERPDASRRFAVLDDQALDGLIAHLNSPKPKQASASRRKTELPKRKKSDGHGE
jgi:transcriptional regulator with XRE-family HTH domain